MTLETTTSITSIAANIATIIAAVVAIGTLVYIAIQAKTSVQILEQNKLDSKTVQTYNLIRAFYDPEYNRHASKSMRFLGNKEISEEEKRRRIEAQDKDTDAENLVISIKIALNLFETVAVMYNRDLLDKITIRNFLKTASLEYFERSQWFIIKARKKFSSTVYEQWEKMNEDLKRF